MHGLSTALRRALGTLAFIVIGSSAAWAPGSITLDDVIEQLQDQEKLTAEIFAELKAQNLKAEEVICVGSRFGGQWRNLGGARAVPFECEIGKKKLAIEGTVHIYDDAGKELDMNEDASFEHAAEYRQADITWKWQ
ncbi:hypothetical protein GIW81_14165 [Hyphomicrobium sp. xq]|uniref:Uncharacterized protein n=1 Tax=Hyphomicrobium album TaxID=2665159 RepID=A0A6I3KNJ8_9HYPH|nr:hypothetical protein [Hyphomicrobium album]MTD95480.1 hypothetical protein [Hyphomicrobium album]